MEWPASIAMHDNVPSGATSLKKPVQAGAVSSNEFTNTACTEVVRPPHLIVTTAAREDASNQNQLEVPSPSYDNSMVLGTSINQVDTFMGLRLPLPMHGRCDHQERVIVGFARKCGCEFQFDTLTGSITAHSDGSHWPTVQTGTFHCTHMDPFGTVNQCSPMDPAHVVYQSAFDFNVAEDPRRADQLQMMRRSAEFGICHSSYCLPR